MDQIGKQLTVVSNTSPLTNLAAIGRFELLQSIFGEIRICRSVESELFSGGMKWPRAAELRQSSWVKIHAVEASHTVDALRLELDLGEAETVMLALQLQADLVLMDEQAGRRAAQYFGLNVMGVVGLLVRAKQKRLISEIHPLIDALRQQAGFYLSQFVVDHALALAGER